MKLIKLPSGDWINPHHTNSVLVFGADKNTEESKENPPRVVVHHSGIITAIPCETIELAKETASTIANMVNLVGGAK